tara:strand:- start:7566 stop:8069 length:504 start_codon:yes stop_codon:yes gene_type:complete
MMTILFLDDMPDKAADAYREEDISAGVTSCFIALTTPIGYDLGVKMNRMMEWSNESLANYSWLVIHAVRLCDRYRDITGNLHRSDNQLRIIFNSSPPDIEWKEFTPVPINLDDKYCSITVKNSPPRTEIDAMYWREEALIRYDPAPLYQAVGFYQDYYEDIKKEVIA